MRHGAMIVNRLQFPELVIEVLNLGRVVPSVDFEAGIDMDLEVVPLIFEVANRALQNVEATVRS